MRERGPVPPLPFMGICLFPRRASPFAAGEGRKRGFDTVEMKQPHAMPGPCFSTPGGEPHPGRLVITCARPFPVPGRVPLCGCCF